MSAPYHVQQARMAWDEARSAIRYELRHGHLPDGISTRALRSLRAPWMQNAVAREYGLAESEYDDWSLSNP